MSRLTRVESQRRTRNDVLAAARRHFSDVGYAAASLDAIAADAGFTRGAIYSNFGGKPGLFLALLDERTDRQIRELDAIGGDLSAVQRWRLRNTKTERGMSLAVQEFRVIALRDVKLRRALRDRDRRVRTAFASVIERAAEELGVHLPLAPQDAASVLLALGDGLTQQHQLDPGEVDPGLFETTLAALVQSQTVSAARASVGVDDGQL